ncbi:hypothetical protein chiPu_0021950 [Chiloscyllium punctatum]|uniref:Uncharacterized protein n=1 Tax=Chiloscyllium punctatum TaxID=137246 RepID=A0A401RFV2_CHIPU|nr:hypothetical protein [Chiloscyllium punctatum]
MGLNQNGGAQSFRLTIDPVTVVGGGAGPLSGAWGVRSAGGKSSIPFHGARDRDFRIVPETRRESAVIYLRPREQLPTPPIRTHRLRVRIQLSPPNPRGRPHRLLPLPGGDVSGILIFPNEGEDCFNDPGSLDPGFRRRLTGIQCRFPEACLRRAHVVGPG